MSDSQETVCFTCGQPAGDPTRLNCLPGGQACPACRDRLLESLPACLPSEQEVERVALTLEESTESSDFDPACSSEPGPEDGKGPREVLHGEGPDQPA